PFCFSSATPSKKREEKKSHFASSILDARQPNTFKMTDIETKRRSIALLRRQFRVTELKSFFESIQEEPQSSTQQVRTSIPPEKTRYARPKSPDENISDPHDTGSGEVVDAVQAALDLLESHSPPQPSASAGRIRGDSTLSISSNSSSGSEQEMDEEAMDGKNMIYCNSLLVQRAYMQVDILAKFTQYAAAAGIRVNIPSSV
ncbi:hypothetical protein BX600DRAFT_528877, partial [Xylariales sp. PMI_506]